MNTSFLTISSVLPYIVFTFFWLLGRRWALSKNHRKNKAVAVSVIIPLRNEADRLPCTPGCGIESWKLPPGSEIIAVDDHSDDGTFEMLRRAESEIAYFKVMRLPPEKSGKKAAIEWGICAAQHPLIITIDADTQPQEESIMAMAQALADEKIRLVCGTVIQQSHGWPGAPFADLEFLALSTSGAAFAGWRIPFLSNGAFLGFRRETFIKVNGYAGNEQFPGGDDVFLTEKIRNHYGNSSICFLTEGTEAALTAGDPNLQEFLARRIRWGSKSAAYGAAGKTITLFILWINLLWLGALVLEIFQKNIKHFGLLTAVKFACDAAILLPVCVRYGQYRLIPYILPSSLLHPVYLLLLALLSIRGRFSWKGRSYKR